MVGKLIDKCLSQAFMKGLFLRKIPAPGGAIEEQPEARWGIWRTTSWLHPDEAHVSRRDTCSLCRRPCQWEEECLKEGQKGEHDGQCHTVLGQALMLKVSLPVPWKRPRTESIKEIKLLPAGGTIGKPELSLAHGIKFKLRMQRPLWKKRPSRTTEHQNKRAAQPGTDKHPQPLCHPLS